MDTKFVHQQKATGLFLDDPRILAELPQFDLLFGGDEEAKAPDWKNLMPAFRNQGNSMWCTAFAGVNIGSAINKKETGEEVTFSPFELFYRTGGSRFGNTLVNAAAGMRQGFVLEEDKPTPKPDSWSEAAHQYYKSLASASPEALIRGKKYAVRSFAVVPTTPAMLRRALSISPLLLAIGIGSDYWQTPAPRRTQYGAYHANVLTNIDTQGNYEIFESLSGRGGFDGHHKLDNDYEILYALSFVDLPNNWFETQEKAKRKPFENALNHYGKPRNMSAEQMAAQDFSIFIRLHPSLTSLAGKYWTVIVNALAYGGYTVTDILNSLTNERRTGKAIFNLDEMRIHN